MSINNLTLCEFDFELPKELIAQYPLKVRDQARLMVIDRKGQKIHHDIFANLNKYLPAKSCLVVNDSKVIRARLLGRRENTGGQVEVFLLNKLSDGCSYKALIRPLGRLRLNEKIQFNDANLTAELINKEEGIVRFNRGDIDEQLQKYGHVPLPPYIKRPDEPIDQEYYQTIYARHFGSVASPTAGLHFTQSLLNELHQHNHTIETVTLHINLATFRMVETNDITKHPMHTEDYSVSKETFMAIQSAKVQGQKIAAVGTTSCRVLETIKSSSELNGKTNIFIYPGYNFHAVDILITNFHLPRSTLLMLVYAFGGIDLMREAYKQAILEKYRFYSYGDAMIIL